jgi:peptidoglycan/LPS O-acetylase OafA/YrhL
MLMLVGQGMDSPTLHYVKSLDGLRGAAISFVLLFHAGFFLPGWTGVQLFFVLSGFLITDILVRTKTAPIQTYLARFYWRRALRIFPVYFLFLLAMAICVLVLGKPDSYGRDWPFLVTSTTNFGRLRDSESPSGVGRLVELG